MEDETFDQATQLGAFGDAWSGDRRVQPWTAEMVRLQREAQERQEAAYAAERAEGLAAVARTRDDTIRQAAVHAALMCEQDRSCVESVLNAATKIEAFLRGEGTQATH